MIKINEFKVREYGKKGYEITLPAVWVKDLHLNIGDLIAVYRDEEDKLILEPSKEDGLNKFIEEQEKEKAEVAGK